MTREGTGKDRTGQNRAEHGGKLQPQVYPRSAAGLWERGLGQRFGNVCKIGGGGGGGAITIFI